MMKLLIHARIEVTPCYQKDTLFDVFHMRLDSFIGNDKSVLMIMGRQS